MPRIFLNVKMITSLRNLAYNLLHLTGKNCIAVNEFLLDCKNQFKKNPQYVSRLFFILLLLMI